MATNTEIKLLVLLPTACSPLLDDIFLKIFVCIGISNVKLHLKKVSASLFPFYMSASVVS